MLSASIKMYKIKDFIRWTETGEIHLEGSKKAIHTLAAAAGYHAGHNILIDLRDTTISQYDMGQMLELALEIARYKSVFSGRIANVIPNDKKRLKGARQFKTLMDVQGFQYEIFTDFEAAIEWLSDVKELGSQKE
ncbi:MAG: hypothetical protein A4E57_01415 [Syntrophorhabdaceae bacterium PtaU1.Bin034]|jgi:hypothetical protein|nr:MAG: hypothetical protein A4E57_01415 [Syntrophorhabdaceae bacterium PtaU1.Bin034]